MVDIAKQIIDHIYTGAIAVEIDWKNWKDYQFIIISYDTEGVINNIIDCFGPDVTVSSIWTHADGYSASLNPKYYRLDSNEHKTEFITAFKQICMDIHNGKLKSQELMDFV
jgi:hypothetical protein